MHATATRRVRFDLSPLAKGTMLAAGGTLGIAAAIALGKAAMGLAPTPAYAKDVAIIVHLTSVLPAIPLGIYVLLTRKGDARHRMLGKVWMLLMLTAAVSAFFIRTINQGGFSWLHLFIPVTFIAAWRAVSAARKGQIARHKRMLVTMFLGALVVPGVFAFAGGRLMGAWLLG